MLEYSIYERCRKLGNADAQEGFAFAVKFTQSDKLKLCSDISISHMRGRPKSNILDAYARSKRQFVGNPTSLALFRAKLLYRHDGWTMLFKQSGHCLLQYNSWYAKQTGSRKWMVFVAIELASLLLGRKFPEDPEKSGKFYKSRDTFSVEAASFWRWCNIYSYIRMHETKRKRFCAEAIFKTALCLYVARKLRYPKGGNSTKLPSCREVAQVWYLIFGEAESHDLIKNRMKTVGLTCKEFPLYVATGDKPRFPTLAGPLLKKYG